MPRYDRAYFDRWYRGADPVITRAAMRRKAALGISVAEYFLGRQLRTVLDIGCGEGSWLLQLRHFRPNIVYLGIDPSDYVVSRFSRSRNIRKGTFLELEAIAGSFDLVICSDVLHYLPPREIRTGLTEICRLSTGVAFLEMMTSEDQVGGDVERLIRRPASWYRRAFRSAGLTQVGPYCWKPEEHDSSPMERVE